MHRRSLLLGTVPVLLAGSLQGEDRTESPFSLSIAIGKRMGRQRSLEYRNAESHFAVVLRNTSDQPQRVWREWCSWGYFLLSFVVTDLAGKAVAVRRPARVWTKNFPDFEEILPGESLVRDIYFGNDAWESFPRSEKADGNPFKLQAVFSSPADDQSKEHNVWSGKVVSPTLDIVVYGLT